VPEFHCNWKVSNKVLALKDITEIGGLVMKPRRKLEDQKTELV